MDSITTLNLQLGKVIVVLINLFNKLCVFLFLKVIAKRARISLLRIHTLFSFNEPGISPVPEKQAYNLVKAIT
ncbi:hypothetical protein DIU36_28385 [Mucilaginibacter rubeus]|nr:hypothetical protein DIU36_28385 [Mucilaginibacter rubeus]